MEDLVEASETAFAICKCGLQSVFGIRTGCAGWVIAICLLCYIIDFYEDFFEKREFAGKVGQNRVEIPISILQFDKEGRTFFGFVDESEDGGYAADDCERIHGRRLSRRVQVEDARSQW